jgi:hypothetical protein
MFFLAPSFASEMCLKLQCEVVVVVDAPSALSGGLFWVGNVSTYSDGQFSSMPKYTE